MCYAHCLIYILHDIIHDLHSHIFPYYNVSLLFQHNALIYEHYNVYFIYLMRRRNWPSSIYIISATSRTKRNAREMKEFVWRSLMDSESWTQYVRNTWYVVTSESNISYIFSSICQFYVFVRHGKRHVHFFHNRLKNQTHGELF